MSYSFVKGFGKKTFDVSSDNVCLLIYFVKLFKILGLTAILPCLEAAIPTMNCSTDRGKVAL